MADQDALARALSGFGVMGRRRDPRDQRKSFYAGIMKAGTDTSPVATPIQGLARALQAGIGGFMLGRENQQEDEGMKRLAEAMSGKLMPDGTRNPVSLEDVSSAAADAGMPEYGMQVALANALDQRARGQRQGQPSITDIATGARGASSTGAAPPSGPTGPGTDSTIDPNNIGNIRDMQRGGFRSYATPEEGVAATIRNVQSYPGAFNGGQPMTLLQIGARWAPKGDGANDPVQWARNVAAASGLPVDQVLDFSNPQIAAAFAQGVHRAEKGTGFAPEVYARGVQMALGGASAPDGVQQAQMPNPPMPSPVPGATPAPMPQPPMPTPGGPNARPAPMPAGPPPATMTRTDTSVMSPVAGPAAGSSGAVPPPSAPTIPMGGPAVPLTMGQIPVQPETPSNAPLRAAEPVGPPTPETAGTKMGADVGAAFGAGIVPPSTRQLLQSPAPTAPPSAAPAPPAAQPAPAAPPAPQQQSAPRQPAQFPDTPNTAAALAADYAATAQRFDAEWKRTGDKDMEAEARRYSAMAAAARAEAMRFDAERPLRMAEWQRRTDADARAQALAERQAKLAETKAADVPEGLKSEFAKKAANFDSLSRSLDRYEAVLKKHGPVTYSGPLAGPKARELSQAYQDVLLQAKEAYNLGVLNGPDYEILQRVMTDPTGWAAAGLNVPFVGQTSDEFKSSLLNQVNFMREKLRDALASAQARYLSPQSPTAPATLQGQGATPAAPARQPSGAPAPPPGFSVVR